MRIFKKIIILLFFNLSLCLSLIASPSADSTKGPKRGFLSNIGHGISISFGKDTLQRDDSIRLNISPFLPYQGKIIRKIWTEQLGFEKGILDTDTSSMIYFGTKILNSLHVKSTNGTISRSIFLNEGTPFNPYLAADNERYFRTLEYIQDCRIKIIETASPDSIDLVYITKDVFAYAPEINNIGPYNQRAGLSNINVAGSGQRLSLSVLHDSKRTPLWGFAYGYGYSNFKNTYISTYITASKISKNIYDKREDEETFGIVFDRPLVSQYKRLAGNISLGKGRSLNRYPNMYGGDFYRYDYAYSDMWIGYNLGAQKNLLGSDRLFLKKFIALRYFNYHFFETPYQMDPGVFDQRFNSRQGVLASLTLFRQSYYKTRFLYGFGVTEDVPSGFNLTFTSGWYKQLTLERPYLGIDANHYLVAPSGAILGSFLRTGMFLGHGPSGMEDVGLVVGTSLFSKVMPIGRKIMRQYVHASYSSIINRKALDPLKINNSLGLQNFSSDLAMGNVRITFRSETIVFLPQKYFGFKLAPFLSAELAWLSASDSVATGTHQQQIDGLFGSIGGGIRARNENLMFGTFEFRFLVLPRRTIGDSFFKISGAIDLKFKYNTGYVSKPDIIELNGDANNDIY